MTSSGSAEVSIDETADTPGSGMKPFVLIVEPNKPIRRLISTCLRKCPFEVRSISRIDSPLARTLLAEATVLVVGAYQPFDIFLAHIQPLASRKGSPIVVVTTPESREDELDRLLQAGVQWVVRMPFGTDQIRQIVDCAVTLSGRSVSE